uniref:SOCS box domain-containing protein n=1 Tax=Trichogramma kaykai TaxID=54128 RepID=A0ABD2X5B6_9HYME
MDEAQQKCLRSVKSVPKKVNRKMDEKNCEFLRKLYPVIRDYNGQLPNLRDIFRPGAIDWLLSESVKVDDDYDEDLDPPESEPLIDFVIATGYTDEPDLDEEGKPLFRHTTAIHDVVRCYRRYLIPDLFKIYDKFDVNYTDEPDGLTHFHAACEWGCDDVVKKFLELGQDPDCLPQEPNTTTVDPPLHKALIEDRKEVVELLLRSGANPNLTNNEGKTSLHWVRADEIGKMFFEIIDEMNQPLQIDVRDQYGWTPLRDAVMSGSREWIELLLARGSDPNLSDEEGSTPLHYICMSYDPEDDEKLAKIFFKSIDNMGLTLQVDVWNNLGQTPLQLAVANLMPNTIDILLNRADLSSFVFPAESYFGEDLKPWLEESQDDFKLRLASGVVAAVENLEKRGYELDRKDALTVMNFFSKHKLFEKSAKKVEELLIRPDLSLYDLIQLQHEEVTKQLTHSDYVKLASLYKRYYQHPKMNQESCAMHLCEKLSWRFFRRWALDPLLKLTHYRLPILCCEMIIEQLINEDLYNICLAAEDQNS